MRSAIDPSAEDPLRGLRLSADQVGWLLEAGSLDPARSGGALAALDDFEADGDLIPAAQGWPRLAELAQTFELTPLDVAVLVLALAPDLDRVFESCYGYLNDDVTRRRATVGLALDLSGREAWDPAARARFLPERRWSPAVCWSWKTPIGRCCREPCECRTGWWLICWVTTRRTTLCTD